MFQSLEGTRVALSGRSTVTGRPVVGAAIRALNGGDELALSDGLLYSSAAQYTDTVLARCVTALVLGGDGPASDTASPDPALLSQLTVGDRDVLLLRVRQLTFGESADLVATCPRIECGAPMDIPLDIDALCAEAPGAQPERELQVGGVSLWLRPATGADQGAVSGLALDDPPAAAREMARHCVVEATDESGRAVDPSALTADILDAAGDAVAALDPHADITLALQCPECGEGFSTPLVAADLLRDETVIRRRELESNVHLLALHYHWSEAEILAIPSSRRRRYVTTLVDWATESARWD